MKSIASKETQKLYYTLADSPLGALTLASDGEKLVGLWIEGQKYHGHALYEGMIEKSDLAIFKTCKHWLDKYFKGENPPLTEIAFGAVGASDFRKAVWEILCAIPYGSLVTYGTISKMLAKRFGKQTMSAQAVGGAVGHNPISIIVPCHRVVGGNGSLTGYAGGIAKKIKLLELEGVDVGKFFVPTKGTAL